MAGVPIVLCCVDVCIACDDSSFKSSSVERTAGYATPPAMAHTRLRDTQQLSGSTPQLAPGCKRAVISCST